MSELEDVLSRAKIAAHLDPAALRHLRQVLANAPVIEDPPSVPISRDPADDYLLALARFAGAAYLVSGDKDLTALKDVVPPVLTPAAFLETLS